MEIQKDIEGSYARYWIIRPVLIVLALVGLIVGTELFSGELGGWFPVAIFPAMLLCGALFKRFRSR